MMKNRIDTDFKHFLMMHNLLPILIACLFSSAISAQTTPPYPKWRIGAYGTPLPLKFGVVYDVGVIGDKAINAEKGTYWSSSVHARIAPSSGVRDLVSISTGLSKSLLPKANKWNLLLGAQGGYLYESWYNMRADAFIIHAGMMRLSAELTYPIKSFELGLISHGNIGYGYRKYTDQNFLSQDGGVLTGFYGAGLLIKYKLGQR